MSFRLLTALVGAAAPLAAQRTPVVRLVNVAGPLVLNGWDRDSVAVRGAARLAVSGPKDAIRVDGSGAGTGAA